MDAIIVRDKMKKRKWIGRMSMALGIVFLAGGLLLFGYNRTKEYLAGKESDTALKAVKGQIEQNYRTKEIENPTLKWDDRSYFGILTIPKLDLELPVQTSWSYPKLQISPCIYSGSIQQGGLVILAHNYRNHFGQIASLAEGDVAFLTDASGEKYEYLVEEVFSMKATDVEEMINHEYDLTLFTCNYDGRARVTVRLVLQNRTNRYPIVGN